MQKVIALEMATLVIKEKLKKNRKLKKKKKRRREHSRRTVGVDTKGR